MPTQNQALSNWRGRFRLAFVLAASASLLSASSAIYTYTGNDFTAPQTPYTTNNFVSGAFTVASPLAPDLAAVDISALVTNLSFADGGVNSITWSTVDAGYRFVVSTDAGGNITAWDVTLIVGNPPTNSAIFTCSGITTYFNSCPSGPFDESYLNNGATSGAIFSNPGSWATSLGSASAPEPATFWLWIAALAALASFARKTGRGTSAAPNQASGT